MTTDATAVTLAALLDGVSVLQGQIAGISQSNSRIEAAQRNILDRLDKIDSSQAAVTDIFPILETILGRLIDDRQRSDAGFDGLATVLVAVTDGQREAREETAAIVPVLEAMASDASADRSDTREALTQLAPAVEKLLEIGIANREGRDSQQPDVGSALAQILANQVEDRKLSRTGFTKTSTMAAFSYAAASGHRGSLPVDVEDDPLLEPYILAQPADLLSSDRALVDWRNAAAAAGTDQLIPILERQYRPSPTDTAETRVLRYRLAAITRSTIEGRGAAPPAPPTTTRAEDRSAVARTTRSQALAALWRGGESIGLYAEPELAGALDLFTLAEARTTPAVEDDISPELVALHHELATQVESGNRPTLADVRPPRANADAIAVELEKDH